jgi:hypothetical protein
MRHRRKRDPQSREMVNLLPLLHELDFETSDAFWWSQNCIDARSSSFTDIRRGSQYNLSGSAGTQFVENQYNFNCSVSITVGYV